MASVCIVLFCNFSDCDQTEAKKYRRNLYSFAHFNCMLDIERFGNVYLQVSMVMYTCEHHINLRADPGCQYGRCWVCVCVCFLFSVWRRMSIAMATITVYFLSGMPMFFLCCCCIFHVNTKSNVWFELQWNSVQKSAHSNDNSSRKCNTNTKLNKQQLAKRNEWRMENLVHGNEKWTRMRQSTRTMKIPGELQMLNWCGSFYFSTRCHWTQTQWQ